MGANGLAAFSQQSATLGTALANFGTAVPVGSERTYRFMRAVNKTSADQTVTVMVGAGALAFEFLIPAKQGLNIVGPETLGPLVAGTQLQARASAASSVDLIATGTDRIIG